MACTGSRNSSIDIGGVRETYPKGEKKRLKRTTFKKPNVLNWFKVIHEWATSPLVSGLNDKLSKYFSQSALNTYAEEGATPLSHPVFALVEEVNAQLDVQPFTQNYYAIIIYVVCNRP